jgi:hypothetical protein
MMEKVQCGPDTFTALLVVTYKEVPILLVPIPAPVVSLAGVQHALPLHWEILAAPPTPPLTQVSEKQLSVPCQEFIKAHVPGGADDP